MPDKPHPTLPPGQQLVAPGKWPIIGERQPAKSNQPWRLTLSGCLDQPTTFDLDQLGELPQSSLMVDIHCVTRWSKLGVEFSGVQLVDLLKEVGANVGATTSADQSKPKYISFVSRSQRRHSTSLQLDVAIAQQTIIATHVDGQPLPIDHGGPIRNVVAGRYFYKSVKWLETIELLQQDRLGFWEAESGYHNNADPVLQERYISSTIDRRAAAKLIASKDFSGRDLMGLSASHRDLSDLKATDAAMRNADFSHSNLRNSDFSRANLSNAHFRESDLRGAQFVDTDLEGADLSGADLRGADFTGSSLIGCSFVDTSVSGLAGAKNLNESVNRLGAFIDHSTTIPPEVIAPLFPVQLEYVRTKCSMGQ